MRFWRVKGRVRGRVFLRIVNLCISPNNAHSYLQKRPIYNKAKDLILSSPNNTKSVKK